MTETAIKSLNIGYFYPELLNLYGDNGNVEVLVSRATHRGIPVKVVPITVDTDIEARDLQDINLVFMGGGPDSGQKSMYTDLTTRKNKYLQNYINNGGVGLYICGAYQLLGNYYKSADGSMLNGLGIMDMYTEHFGLNKPRCIGNTLAELSSNVADDEVFPKTALRKTLVGFENHGGRTYLNTKNSEIKPFAKILKGHGNNSEDQTEGAIVKNSFGSYFHGPLLSKNPHFADYLIYKALGMTKDQIETLPKLNDSLITAAHIASKKLKR